MLGSLPKKKKKKGKTDLQGLKKTYRVFSVGDLSPTGCVGGVFSFDVLWLVNASLVMLVLC